jgi:hypothetical protein
MAKLVYNFDRQTIRIITNPDDIDYDFEMSFNMLDNFYVMQIIETCTSNDEFVFTSHDNYYEKLKTYMNEYEIKEEDMDIKNNIFELDNYIVHETFHFLAANLSSFRLYKMNKKH